MDKIKAPGLKYRKLVGRVVPIWVADENDVKLGYLPKTVNLEYMASDPEMLRAKCDALQADMLLWRKGYRRDPLAFDGTVLSLLTIYQRHPESPFRNLRPGTLHPYRFYLARLEGHIGNRRIDTITGVDITKWHKLWSKEGTRLAAAAMARTVLESAISFGLTLRLPGCADLIVIVRETRKKLPKRRPRDETITAEEVVAARLAAHQGGSPSRALVYAIVFETVLRLWDVIGQWWPMDRGGISDVLDPEKNLKWFGLRWEDIDKDMVLRLTPTKTSLTTGARVVFPLAKAPMVLEELEYWPAENRIGPIAVSEETGLPYDSARFTVLWNRDKKAAGISPSAWARDIRASAITEARSFDASTDDAAKVAAHSKKQSSRVYDRAVREASERFADVRIAGREQGSNNSGNGSGNGR